VAGGIWINSGNTSFTKCLFDSNSARSAGFGGAVVPEGDSVNLFEDCEFRNNEADYGGAVDDGTVAITLFKNCHFHDNTAVQGGGGYYAFASSRATFEDCRFERNVAIKAGGAVQIVSTASPLFLNCIFENNVAPTSSHISAAGGLLTTLENCKFRSLKTGPTANSGGHIGSQSNIRMNNCDFMGGKALKGGSIYLRSTVNVTIKGCSFERNYAVTEGGSIHIEGFFDESNKDPSSILIDDCSFKNSRARANGGALSAVGSSNFEMTVRNSKFESNEAGTQGGAISIAQEMTLNIKDCRFESNKAATGGASSVDDSATVIIDNSRFTKNEARFGGSLAQSLKGSFRVRDSSFERGSAVFDGGALFSSQTATSCSRFENSKFVENQAAVAGGAFFFADRTPPSGCINKRESDSIESYCSQCEFINNEAGYGPKYATSASVLHFEGREKMKRVSPSELFEVAFLLEDYYGQRLVGFIDTIVNARVVSSNGSLPVLRGDRSKQPLRDGSVSFNNLRWGAKPGERVSLVFSTDPPTTETRYLFEIQNCGNDQELYQDDQKSDHKKEKEMVWYCLDVKDPDVIARDLTFAGVAVVLFLSFVTLGLLYWKRGKKPIKNASPVFCYSVVVGVILSTVSVTMWTRADNGMCVLRGWLLALGSSLMFGSLFVREWRLLWIIKTASKRGKTKEWR